MDNREPGKNKCLLNTKCNHSLANTIILCKIRVNVNRFHGCTCENVNTLTRKDTRKSSLINLLKTQCLFLMGVWGPHNYLNMK